MVVHRFHPRSVPEVVLEPVRDSLIEKVIGAPRRDDEVNVIDRNPPDPQALPHGTGRQDAVGAFDARVPFLFT